MMISLRRLRRESIKQLASKQVYTTWEEIETTYTNVIGQHFIGNTVITKDVIIDRRAGNNGASEEAEDTANS
jgi:hypothetical protein